MSTYGEGSRHLRRALIRTIAAEAVETAAWLGKEMLDDRVLAAIEQVPRHLFVAPSQCLFAYENRPLPIGHGQTISQPFIVAVMSDLAGIRPGDRVLEIGTGCGYQTAVLAVLGGTVTTVERIPELAVSAAERLSKLGYRNVTVHQGDGSLGWPEEAPFDAIVVTAAASDRAPPPLLEQLAAGGRLVIPIEREAQKLRFFSPRAEQELSLVTKDLDGRVTERSLLPVAFVPLIEAGPPRDAPR